MARADTVNCLVGEHIINKYLAHYIRRLRSLAITITLLSLYGCAGMGAATLDRDRFDFTQAVANSWKRQILLNIVKMRYADTPIFVDVGQVISGYEVEGTFSAGGGIGNNTAPGALGNFLNLGASGRYLDRPTITYAPLTGSDFIQTFMTPIPLIRLFELIEAGWSIDMLFDACVQTVNGLSNARAGGMRRAADPEFYSLLKSLRRIQESDAIGMAFRPEKNEQGEGLVLFFPTKNVPPDIQKEREQVKRLLGLNPDKTEFRVIYGAAPQTNDTLALHTRSGFQILFVLSLDVQVPEEHMKEQRAYPAHNILFGEQETSPYQVRILSGPSRPAEAFAMIQYNDLWFWIDNRDLRSKGAFSFLLVLMTLSETTAKNPSPILTIRAN